MKDRIITTEFTEPDIEIESSLRPTSLEEYIGQSRVKKQMGIFITAAKNRGESLDHVLLYGPPGLGKTTLANIIAGEMGTHIRITSGPAIEKPGGLHLGAHRAGRRPRAGAHLPGGFRRIPGPRGAPPVPSGLRAQLPAGPEARGGACDAHLHVSQLTRSKSVV